MNELYAIIITKRKYALLYGLSVDAKTIKQF